MSNMLLASKYRNAKTQHGDYRSVDEENIVVLRFCHSPVPGAYEESGGDDIGEGSSAMNKDSDVCWFDYDFPEKVVYILIVVDFMFHSK